ncbi:MAG: S-layer homology domain-containing protein [Trueperaceae bacterium]
MRIRRLTAVLMLASLVAVTGMTPAAAASRTTEKACPAGIVPESAYSDRGGAHGPSIDCVRWWGLHLEAADGSLYGAARDVTRVEHAVLLAGLLDASGLEDAGSPLDQGFDDVRGTEYAPQINRLASLGVINGKSATEFDPQGNIRRDQMAALFVRLHQQVYDRTLPLGDAFADTVGSVHEENIRRLVGAGITAGTTATTYNPGGNVTHGQMASFLMRYVDLLVELDLAQPPYLAEPIVVSGKAGETVPVELPLGARLLISCTSPDTHAADYTLEPTASAERDFAGRRGYFCVAPSAPVETVSMNFFGTYPWTQLPHIVSLSSETFDWTATIRDVSDAPAVGTRGTSKSARFEVLNVSAIAGRYVTFVSERDALYSVQVFDRYASLLPAFAGSCGGGVANCRFQLPDDAGWIEVAAPGDWRLVVE